MAGRQRSGHNIAVSEEPTAAERLRVLALLKRHGREATSFQILEPGLRYWFFGEDACVAYADVGRAWVTAGEPVCPETQVGIVAAAFARAAEDHGKRARFFHVSQGLAAQAGLASTHIGEQPIWDPTRWEQTLAGQRSLREQLRRARAKGVGTRIVDPSELADPAHPTRERCEALIRIWLHSRGMHEMKFMVLVHPFEFAHERRFVLAEHQGRIVGFAAAVPVYGRSGWFIEDLVRDPQAPNGTAESLVDALFKALASEDCHYATLGLAPLSGEVGPALALTRSYAGRLYNFAGVRAFKEKLRPERWEPVHLAFPRSELGIWALRDVLAAFASGGLVQFAASTLVHQRTLATALLASLLVPWTLGLALMDTSRWFPSTAIQRAWVGFDVLLIALMFALVVRWRSQLASAVVALTTLDALLTTLQVAVWNMWTARHLADWALIVVGCAGPLLAAAFFWNTRLVSVRGRLR